MRTNKTSAALFLVLLCAVLAFSACRKQTQATCPAYTSAFILNQEQQKQQFWYFGEDSVPKKDPLVKVSRDRSTGLMKSPKKAKRLEKKLMYIPMALVPEELDSTQMDTTGLIAGTPSNEQLVYDKMFGEILEQQQKEREEERKAYQAYLDSLEANPPAKGLKRLFGGNKKEKTAEGDENVEVDENGNPVKKKKSKKDKKKKEGNIEGEDKPKKEKVKKDKSKKKKKKDEPEADDDDDW